MQTRHVVVVAEDDDELRSLLVTALCGADRQVVEVEDGSELLDYLAFLAGRGFEKQLPDLIVTDVQMPGASGLDVVAWARARGVTCPFIILTGFVDERLLSAAVQVGNTRVLNKPQTLEAIRAAAREALINPR